METSLHDLLVSESIRRCIARLARGEDRRDAELLRASFWPDATVDFGNKSVVNEKVKLFHRPFKEAACRNEWADKGMHLGDIFFAGLANDRQAIGRGFGGHLRSLADRWESFL